VARWYSLQGRETETRVCLRRSSVTGVFMHWIIGPAWWWLAGKRG
jgi:hypothetical protein